MCSLLSDTSSLLFPFTVVVSDILLNVLPYFSSSSLFPFLSAILSIAPLSPPSPPSPPSPLSLCNHRSSSINDMGGVKGTNRPLISRRKDRGWGTRSTCADLGGVKASTGERPCAWISAHMIILPQRLPDLNIEV